MSDNQQEDVMETPLLQWIDKNRPGDEMIWHNDFFDQVMFVRDKVGGLLARTYEEYRSLVRVVATHYSKSIRCPVYYIHLKRDDVHVWMRYNFFDWNITVRSPKEIDCDFIGCFDDRNHYYCFCQGMEKWKAGLYGDDKRHFTICVNNHYDAYVFFRVLKQFLKIVPED